MLSCKKILLIILIIICTSSCSEHRILFDFENDVTANFLEKLPGVGKAKYLTYQVVSKAASVEIYKSSFREKFIEKDHLLEYTEMNDASLLPSVDYWDMIRYSQDLYMMKYQFKWIDTSQITHEEEAVVFLSVKKDRDESVIGVSPCYWGILDHGFNYISFTQPLSFKEKKPYFYLKLDRINSKKPGLLFMPAGFSNNPIEVAEKVEPFNIEKIVVLNPNKVGGHKPLVFNIKDILRDENALQFQYIKTLTLKR